MFNWTLTHETIPVKNAKNNYGYLRYFFSLERKTYIPKHRCLKIRLCAECIKESIINCGFGYFLSDWYTANYCTKHHIALIEIEPHNRIDAIRLISSALRGDKIVNSNEVKTKSHLSAEHIKSNGKNQTTITRTPTSYFAPCSIKIMMRFVLKQGIAAMDKELTYRQMESIKKNIETKTRIRGIVEGRLFRFLVNHDFRGFKNHWDKSIEYTKVDYGIFTKGKLVETIIKDREKCCKQCDLECDYGPIVLSADH